MARKKEKRRKSKGEKIIGTIINVVLTIFGILALTVILIFLFKAVSLI